MKLNVMADALVKAEVVAEDDHPDEVDKRRFVRAWTKAINWVQKQNVSSIQRILAPRTREDNFVPKYLDRHRVRMVAQAFLVAKMSGENEVYLGDIEQAFRFRKPELKAEVYDLLKLAFHVWIANRGKAP